MEKISGKTSVKFRKVCRIAWGLLLAFLTAYVSVLFFGVHIFEDRFTLVMYEDGLALVWFAMVGWLVLFLAKSEKDFLKGFRLAFSKREGVSRMELCRALKAVEYAGRIIVLEGITAVTVPLVYELYHSDFRYAQMWWGPSAAVLFLHVLYTAIACLVLLPVRIRLDRMVITYMEEPEEGEPEKVDEQTVYFRLRGMGLTDREAEVARLVCSGLSNKEVGERLYISVPTVKKHMSHILEKAECPDREALAEKLRGQI